MGRVSEVESSDPGLLDEFIATPIDVLGFARKQLVRKGSDMHVCQRDVDSQLKKIKKDWKDRLIDRWIDS